MIEEVGQTNVGTVCVVCPVLAAWDGSHGFISAAEQQTLFVGGESRQSKLTTNSPR